MNKTAAFLRRHALLLPAFLIPFVLLSAAFFRFGMFPFGEKSVMIADTNSCYVDYFSNLRDVLTGQSPGGFLYSWSAGPGLGYSGFFAYHLCSPFSLLVLLFPKGSMTEALLLMILLKIGSSGVSFFIFARKKYGLPPLLALIFSSSYALSAYSVVYTINLMWLDAVILLPLVILGLDRLIEGKGILLYCIALALTLITNFYIGYMVGIFCFLYFLVESGKAGGTLRRLLYSVRQFALSSIAGIALAAVILLPAFFSIFDNYQKIGGFQPGLTQRYTLIDIASKLFLGSYESVTYGTPNIYAGVLTLLLASLYFLNRGVPRKKRFFSLILPGVFLFSFLFTEPDLAWHMFRVPTWYPFRYSFLWVFAAVCLACECVKEREGLRVPDILVTAGFWGAVLLFLDQKKLEHLTRGELLENLVFLLFYTAFAAFILSDTGKRSKIAALTAGAALLLSSGELYRNTASEIEGLDNQFRYQDRGSYRDFYLKYSEIVNEIRDGAPFYRTGVDSLRNSNDPLSLNIRGLTHYSSLSNQWSNIAMGGFGYYNGFADRNFFYFGASNPADSIFGIKYIISPDRRDFGLRKITEFGDEVLYENENVLPLGFLAGGALLELPARNDDPFDQINRFLRYSLGTEEDYYHKIPGVSGSHITEGYDGGRIETGSGTVDFTIENDRAQQLYFYSKNNFAEGSSVFVNGEQVSAYPQYRVKGVLGLGYFEAGETVRVSIQSWAEDSSFDSALFYGISPEVFAAAADALKAGGLVLDREPGAVISGTVSAGEDGRVLFLSVPYEKGWKARVDGKKAEILKVADGFMALRVGRGEHTVRLRYLPRGFVPGVILSAAGLAGLVLYIVLRRRGRGRGRGIRADKRFAAAIR